MLVYLVLALPLVGAYALYATGIVVIHQASRVINLAHGAMATLPAYLFQTMIVRWHVPLGVALPAAVASGAVLGSIIERWFVRRLRDAGPTAQTVGTVAAFGLVVSVVAKVFGTGGIPAPHVFGEGHLNVGASILRYGEIGLFAVAVLVSFALAEFFRRTWTGISMRGAAENRRGAALQGIDPDRAATMSWMIGGALATLAGILLAAVTILSPYSLSLSVLPAFVAALIGGLNSLPRTLLGAGVVGIVLGFVPAVSGWPGFRVVLGQPGGAELALAVVAMAVMAARGIRLGRAEPGAARSLHAPRGLSGGWAALIAIAAVGWIFIPRVPFSIQGDANQALVFSIVALSIVVLTGWVGQISLAQAAFVGIGGFSTALLSRRLGIAFPFSLPIAAAVAAGTAALLGVVALRVRGLYLAVATLIFGWMADSYLFGASWFAGAGGSATVGTKPIGVRGGFPYFDFTNRKVIYLIGLAGLGIAILVLSNLRRSKTGRAFFAIRGSETAAASLGIDVTRYKLMAFAISGAMAGVAGVILAVGQQTIVPSQFSFTVSLLFVSIAVVGGTSSIGGAIGSAGIFALLNELFLRVDALHGYLEVASAVLLASVLLFFPDGLPALGRRVRVVAPAPLRRVLREARALRRELSDIREDARRFADRNAMLRAIRSEGREIAGAIGSLRNRARRREAKAIAPREDNVTRIEPGPVLNVEDLTVRYGGLVAVEGVDLEVRAGEIVGLIGPNGAGKTTLFNAIAGFSPLERGRVLVGGTDVTRTPPHERGIGRTFQQLQLFGGLTVEENLMVATHARNETGLGSHIAVTAHAVRAEREAAARARDVATELALEDLLDSPVDGLSFGTLRRVELARALVTGAPLIMLDEPASGLDNAETDRLGALLQGVRDDLGVAVLLIEHDVRLVEEVCDRVYALDAGRLIARGTAREVLEDESVGAAYLGQPPAALPEPA